MSPPVPTANVPSNIKGTLATSVINPVNPPTTASMRIPELTSCPLAAAETPPYIPPKTKPIPKAIANEIAKCPEGSYLLIGLLPQYANKFNPLMFSRFKYSIESGEIHLHNSGE